MHRIIMSFFIFFFSICSNAIPLCVQTSGEFPHWVYDTDSKIFLGVSGYRTEDLCLKAIATKDLRIACAPARVPDSFGSVVVKTADGTLVGYENQYYTSVNYCSVAIRYTRGGTICVPSGGKISLVDFVKGQKIGNDYSSVEYCKWASLSAESFNRDPYICSMNRKGSTEVFHRENNQWMGLAFSKSKDCYEYLQKYRRHFP